MDNFLFCCRIKSVLCRFSAIGFVLLLIEGILTFTASCTSTHEDELEVTSKVSLDKPMSVLVLGNSFSVDGTAYIDELSKAADIDTQQYGIYNGVINGGGFAEWVAVFEKNKSYSFSKMAGNLAMNNQGTLKSILSQKWDVVVLMQASDKSYLWDTFEESAGRLIDIIKEHCTSPEMRLAYAIPWGHTAATSPAELKGNVECARKLVETYGIDLIIPVGVAVENARQTRLNNDMNLTRDKWHLCFGVGRYIAACTWYESLLAPRTGLSIVGNVADHPLSKSERMYDNSIAVDSTNRSLCQKCAFFAVHSPYEVSMITE